VFFRVPLKGQEFQEDLLGDFVTLYDGTDRLSRIGVTKLPLDAA